MVSVFAYGRKDFAVTVIPHRRWIRRYMYAALPLSAIPLEIAPTHHLVLTAGSDMGHIERVPMPCRTPWPTMCGSCALHKPGRDRSPRGRFYRGQTADSYLFSCLVITQIRVVRSHRTGR